MPNPWLRKENNSRQLARKRTQNPLELMKELINLEAVLVAYSLSISLLFCFSSCPTVVHCTSTRGGKQTFFEVRKSQIREFFGSFRYRKSANFSGVPVRNLQIRNLYI